MEDGDGKLDQVEPDSHSFIVKVWVEETAVNSSRTVWRGHITHVISGRRGYFKTMDEMAAFIAPYFPAADRNPGLGWRLRRMLKQWTRLFRSPT